MDGVIFDYCGVSTEVQVICPGYIQKWSIFVIVSSVARIDGGDTVTITRPRSQLFST